MSVMLVAGVGAAVASGTTTMRSTNNPTLGRILEGPARYTLYVFVQGTSTRGSSHSSSKFPPIIASGRVVAASGSKINSSKLGTKRLSNGKHQVTYYGQPLYLFKGDTKPGTTNGENKFSGRGAYFVIGTSGRPINPPGY